MVATTTDVQTGMAVYSSDGEKLGEIKEVYPSPSPASDQTGEMGTSGEIVVEAVVAELPPDEPVIVEAMYDTFVPGAGGTSSGAGSTNATGYFKVEHGGILGIGAKDLYIPFSAVSAVVSGDRVTVSCTQDDCIKQYETKPDFLDKQDSGNKRS